MIQVVPVNTPALRRAFVDLAWTLRGSTPAWVPPWRPDQVRLLDPGRGDFFRSPGNRVDLFLARRDGAWVGRIAAIHNATHLATHGDGAGFFGFFECADDREAAAALLRRAEDWIRDDGLRIARGPANLSIQEEAGVLLDGFEHQPMAGMNHTPPYYRDLLESAGYTKAKDLLVFRADPTTTRFDQLGRISAAAERQSGLRVRTLDMGALEPEAVFLARVFADAWRDNWGAVPIGAAEFQQAYEHYRMFLVPELVYLAEVGGEPAGAFIALPDMNVLVKAAGGRIWPLGWWRMLAGRRRLTRYRVLMMGVRPQYRRHGIPLVFLHRCSQELLRRGMTLVEFSWVLEDNHETIAIIERIGGHRVQTLRLYEKEVS